MYNFIPVKNFKVTLYHNLIKKKNNNFLLLKSTLSSLCINNKKLRNVRLLPPKLYRRQCYSNPSLAVELNDLSSLYFEKFQYKLNKNFYLTQDICLTHKFYFNKFFLSCLTSCVTSALFTTHFLINFKCFYTFQNDYFNVFYSVALLRTFVLKRCLLMKALSTCFFVILSPNLFYCHVGFYSKLEILGYARRSWFSHNKSYFYLKLGQSYINKVRIPNRVLLRLVKRRMITIFTFTRRLLNNFSYKLYRLKSADNYKGFGVRLSLIKLVLKNKRILK